MNHQEGFFKGVRNANIYYQCWLPEYEPKAILLIVHGLAEHSGRYMNLVDHFVPLGYAVYGLDHLGHGKSQGTRVYVDQLDDYTITLKTFFDMVKQWQPDKSIFIIGHSMGGLIVPVYLLDHQEELNGAIISAPMVKIPENVTQTTIFMGKVLSKILPKFGIVAVDAEGVSRDPAVVQAYVNDPLVYRGKTTARLAAEFLTAMQRCDIEMCKITLPILILQGRDDKLIDPSCAQKLYDSVNSTDKTLKIYDGLYHEVFNEPEHELVLKDLQAWLEAHIN